MAFLFPSDIKVRLKRRNEFVAVQRSGKRIHTEDFLIFVKRQSACAHCNEGESRVGLTVSRKIGGAVTRNRIKRRLREAWRLAQFQIPAGFDLVIVAKRTARAMSWDETVRQVERVIKKLTKMRQLEQSYGEKPYGEKPEGEKPNGEKPNG